MRRVWVSDIARGMAYLYSQGVEHRDLKSANVLLTEKKRAKVADFGLSKCEDLKTTVASTMDAGGLAGTWAFMAPELLRNRRFTEKSDVYSFAFVLWEVHDRGQPWDGLQQPQIITQVLVEHARPKIPDMPRDLRDLMVRAWSDDPDGRPTFADAVKELQGTIPRQRPPSTSAGQGAGPRQGTTRAAGGTIWQKSDSPWYDCD